MFEKIKEKIGKIPKEAVKEEVKSHIPEILACTALLMLGYLCIKSNMKSVNITINVNGGLGYERF